MEEEILHPFQWVIKPFFLWNSNLVLHLIFIETWERKRGHTEPLLLWEKKYMKERLPLFIPTFMLNLYSTFGGNGGGRGKPVSISLSGFEYLRLSVPSTPLHKSKLPIHQCIYFNNQLKMLTFCVLFSMYKNRSNLNLISKRRNVLIRR